MHWEEFDEPRLSRRWCYALTAVYIVAMLNVFSPVVRLTDDEANTAALGLLQLLPLFALVNALVGWSGLRRVGVVLVLLPLCAAAVAVWLLLLIGTVLGSEREKLQTIPTGWSRITVYRTNGGATTGFGIFVRQECPVFPGVLIVRELANEYPADSVAVELLSSRQVRLIFPGDDPGSAGKTIIRRLVPMP